MALDTALALVGFAFVMSISPGPGNFLLLASGVNFGFARSLPLLFGISLGFLAMVCAVGLGLGQIMATYSDISVVLRLACALYVAWLAWRIAKSRSLGSGNSDNMDKPLTFAQAATLQLVNPKAWAVALIVTASYMSPEAPVVSLMTIVPIFAAVNLPAIAVWAVSGVGLRRFLASGNRIAVFNLVIAGLLIASMAPVLLSAAR